MGHRPLLPLVAFLAAACFDTQKDDTGLDVAGPLAAWSAALALDSLALNGDGTHAVGTSAGEAMALALQPSTVGQVGLWIPEHAPTATDEDGGQFLIVSGGLHQWAAPFTVDPVPGTAPQEGDLVGAWFHAGGLVLLSRLPGRCVAEWPELGVSASEACHYAPHVVAHQETGHLFLVQSLEGEPQDLLRATPEGFSVVEGVEAGYAAAGGDLLLVILERGERVLALDPETGAERWSHEPEGTANAVEVLGDLGLVAVAERGPSLLRVLDGATGEQVALVDNLPTHVGWMTASGDGSTIAVAETDRVTFLQADWRAIEE